MAGYPAVFGAAYGLTGAVVMVRPLEDVRSSRLTGLQRMVTLMWEVVRRARMRRRASRVKFKAERFHVKHPQVLARRHFLAGNGRHCPIEPDETAKQA